MDWGFWGEIITPLDLFESLASGIPQYKKYDGSLKHASACRKHEIGNCLEGSCQEGKPLCLAPHIGHGKSLAGDVDCVLCRDLWHFQVDPENYIKTKTHYQEFDIFTSLALSSYCTCFSCRLFIDRFFNGKPDHRIFGTH